MKNKFIALVLCLFFGSLGLHHFYLGNSGRGLLYFLFFWTGIPLILSLFDFVGLAITSDRSFNRKYNA